MTPLLPYYRKALNDQLIARIERNSKYSLRAFAASLRMDSGALSKILNGTRFLSERLATEILERLDFSAEERELFLSSLAKARVKAGIKRMSPSQRARVLRDAAVPIARDLTTDAFKLVSDWYHYAILELTRVKGFQNDGAWIAKRLGISATEAVQAVDRLLTLELLEEREGKLVATSFHLNTLNHGITSAAHRRRQLQILKKSMVALENQPIEDRNHSARTVAIDPRKIPEAKRRIEEFMMKLCDELASEEKLNVYELSVQLFSLEETQPQKSGEKNEE